TEAALREAIDRTRLRAVAALVSCAQANTHFAGHLLQLPAAMLGGNDPSLHRAHAPVQPVIGASRTNLQPREGMSVQVLMHNAERVEDRADLSLQVVGPTRQVLWKKKRGVKLPKSGRELWSGQIEASGTVGEHQFIARLLGP